MKVSFQKQGNTNALKTIGGSEFLLQPKDQKRVSGGLQIWLVNQPQNFLLFLPN